MKEQLKDNLKELKENSIKYVKKISEKDNVESNLKLLEKCNFNLGKYLDKNKK